MPFCTKCGTKLPKGGNFCAKCGTEAAKIATSVLASQQPEPFLLVCPKCAEESSFDILTTRSEHKNTCPKCATQFVSWLAEVTSKDSNSVSGGRDFVIGVREVDIVEDTIKFSNTAPDDIELRPEERVIFTYLNGRLKVVQNLTFPRNLIVTEPSSSGCYVATYLYGPASVEVATLRRFRDQTLRNSAILSLVVRVYYATSPWLVKHLGPSRTFRAVMRRLVEPVIRLARRLDAR